MRHLIHTKWQMIGANLKGIFAGFIKQKRNSQTHFIYNKILIVERGVICKTVTNDYRTQSPKKLSVLHHSLLPLHQKVPPLHQIVLLLHQIPLLLHHNMKYIYQGQDVLIKNSSCKAKPHSLPPTTSLHYTITHTDTQCT